MHLALKVAVPVAAVAGVAVMVHRHGHDLGHPVAGGVLVGNARSYDRITGLLLGGFYDGVAADIAAAAASGAAVLDVGCGPGHLTRRLAALGIEATGIDLDPDMIERAAARGSTRGRGPVPRGGRGGTAVRGRRLRHGREHALDAPLGGRGGRARRDGPRRPAGRQDRDLGPPRRRAAARARAGPAAHGGGQRAGRGLVEAVALAGSALVASGASSLRQAQRGRTTTEPPRGDAAHRNLRDRVRVPVCGRTMPIVTRAGSARYSRDARGPAIATDRRMVVPPRAVERRRPDRASPRSVSLRSRPRRVRP